MNNIKYYKNLWREKTSGELNPKWSYMDDFKELKFFLDEIKYDCLELGCGNGDLYSVSKDYYKSYTGVDFSNSNIDIFRKNFFDINLYCEDIIAFRPQRNFSLIHSNQLMQYLNKNQIRELIKWNLQYLDKDGIIIHRQIPDKKLMNLYFSGYLKPNINHIKVSRIMYPFLYKVYDLFKKISFSHSDFGYWYNAHEILEICHDLGANAELYGSKLYRYRYNILIKT